MESLSDTDLTVLEMLGFAGYSGPSPVELTCESVKNYILNPGDCWSCLSSRKRHELVVSAFGNPGPANIALVRQALQLIEQCLTHDQIAALLDYYKYTYILA